jgi:hypothetical protein
MALKIGQGSWQNFGWKYWDSAFILNSSKHQLANLHTGNLVLNKVCQNGNWGTSTPNGEEI